MLVHNKILIGILFGLSIATCAYGKDCQRYKRIVELSVPKCGTHLLMRCLELLGKRCAAGPEVVSDGMHEIRSLSQDQFWVNHLVYRTDYAKILSSERYAPIFMYRDPRDQLVSYAYHMKKRTNRYPQAKHISIEDILTDQITVGKLYHKQRQYFTNIDEVYRIFLPWMGLSNMLCIRFEDLVGFQGGGSDEVQLDIVKKIAVHIGMNISDAQAENVAQNLFGKNNGFFREGEIGAWKKHFTSEHKRLFKERAGQLLIDLKYEKDLNW